MDLTAAVAERGKQNEVRSVNFGFVLRIGALSIERGLRMSCRSTDNPGYHGSDWFGMHRMVQRFSYLQQR